MMSEGGGAYQTLHCSAPTLPPNPGPDRLLRNQEGDSSFRTDLAEFTVLGGKKRKVNRKRN